MHIVTNSQCGCQAGTDSFGNVVFKYCPKHKAAPKQNEALLKIREDINWMLNNRQFLSPEVFNYIDEALSKAEGK